jgi:SAM-dependent methyltransferase
MDRQGKGWIDKIVSELRQVSRASRSIRGMYALYQFVTFRKDVLLQDLRDRWHAVGSEGGLPLPPALLRYRVHGALDQESFLIVGRECVNDLRGLLSSVGREIGSFRRILDFGCGCGRTLRYLSDLPSDCRLCGTDIDAKLIAWCEKFLPQVAEWSVNGFEPPMRYAGATFDLIYGISVFTHLDEPMQLRWLAEIKRVLAPGGVAIFTVHGKSTQVDLPAPEQAALKEKGFLFRTSQTGRLKLDGLPDFYQTAYHSREYVEREWGKFFRIAQYLEKGIAHYQDAVVLVNEAV